MSQLEIIPKLFKSEYGNLVAVLCHYYGLRNIQIAEDIVSETFYQAMQTWAVKGIPDNPKAWLRKVAGNKSTDLHRREKLTRDKILPQFTAASEKYDTIEFEDATIHDSQLKMIFAVCDPSLKMDAQICLALRLLCGFGTQEIAEALFSNKESILKKLQRAKAKLREVNIDIHELPSKNLQDRIDGVLRTLYLLFNEGYYSHSPQLQIRKEMCIEAMRLALLLTHYPKFNLSRVKALIALMSFHASRFEARIDAEGNTILYDDQDRTLWDNELILKGEEYLNRSAEGNLVSKYHLEAAIAYWHTTDQETKWEHILQLYNKLLTIEYSPIAALNRTYAFAKTDGPDKALAEMKKIKLEDNYMFHSLMAELYNMKGDNTSQKTHLDKALQLTKKESEIDILEKKRNELGR